LTAKGKEKAFEGRNKARTLPPRKDGKMIMLMYDIPKRKQHVRQAFRGALEYLDYQMLQKSVWVHAFPCRAEVELLKKFFGLSSQEIRLIVAKDIVETQHLERRFQLSL
jgi:CRISPR-associated endonuclease Cas2